MKKQSSTWYDIKAVEFVFAYYGEKLPEKRVFASMDVFKMYGDENIPAMMLWECWRNKRGLNERQFG